MKCSVGSGGGTGRFISLLVITLMTWETTQASPTIPLEPVSVENEGSLPSLQSLSSSDQVELEDKLLLKYYQPRHVHISYGGNSCTVHVHTDNMNDMVVN